MFCTGRAAMLEAEVERRLKRLETYGFEVLKLRTPGYNGTKDRLILAPKWSPNPRGPTLVETKAPGKYERALQIAVRNDWRARGVDVRDMCDTFAKINDLCDDLLVEAILRRAPRLFHGLPDHIIKAYNDAHLRVVTRVPMVPPVTSFNTVLSVLDKLA